MSIRLYRRREFEMNLNTQPRAFILIGPSGSGKSTVRKRIERLYCDETVGAFSLDDIRISLYSREHTSAPLLSEETLYGRAYDWCLENQKLFDEAVTNTWSNMLHSCKTIIVDNVNASRKSRAKWVSDLKNRGFEVVMVEVHTPLDVILARQKTRGDKSVPEVAVRAQYNRIEQAMLGSECDKLIVIDGTKQYTETEWHSILSVK